jgi:hypothetical protein
VKPQDQLTQPTINANAQLTKKETKEFGALLINLANAQPTFLYGMESTALSAQLELNSTLRKSNVITVQMDSLETSTATLASRDFENDPFIALNCLI